LGSVTSVLVAGGLQRGRTDAVAEHIKIPELSQSSFDAAERSRRDFARELEQRLEECEGGEQPPRRDPDFVYRLGRGVLTEGIAPMPKRIEAPVEYGLDQRLGVTSGRPACHGAPRPLPD
jgi:hypothetical protein